MTYSVERCPLLIIKALGVHLKEDGDAVTGLLGDPSGRHAAGESRRDGGIAQVIRTAGQERRGLLGRKRRLPGAVPQPGGQPGPGVAPGPSADEKGLSGMASTDTAGRPAAAGKGSTAARPTNAVPPSTSNSPAARLLAHLPSLRDQR